MNKKGKKRNRILAAIALTVLLLQFITPSELRGERWTKADCDAALLKCGFTAILFTFGNPALGTAFGTFCAMGYVWCMEFIR